MDETDMLRRRSAKRFNEAAKLLATFLNNLAIGVLIAGVLTPTVAERKLPAEEIAGLAVAAFVLHILGQAVLRMFLKSEE